MRDGAIVRPANEASLGPPSRFRPVIEAAMIVLGECARGYRLWRGSATSTSSPDGHVVLDLECLDRIYLNPYVPTLQVGGQVVTFFDQPITSPVLFQQMGEAFREAVAAFAKQHRIR